jgi:hypothetical protein
MPIRVIPLPRVAPRTHHEASGLRTGRDSDTPLTAWKKAQDATQQSTWLIDAVVRLQQEFNRLRIRKGGETLAGSIEVDLCDESTGDIKTYVLYGYLKDTGGT